MDLREILRGLRLRARSFGRSLRGRLLVAFLLVVATTLGSSGLFLLLVGPPAFIDALGHFPDDGMNAAMDGAVRQAFAHALLRSLAAATLLAVLVATAVSLVVAARIARPAARLARAVRGIAAGKYAERVRPQGPAELDDLATSFNAMAASLEANDRRRLQLVGDVAHELRTPLTTLGGYLEGLEDGVIDAGPQTWRLLRGEADRLSRLVEDLAELWRAEAHELPLHLGPVDAALIARRVQSQFGPVARQRGVTVEVRGAAAPVVADSDRLAQVLENYLSNALRHAPARSRVVVACEGSGACVRVAVSDEGPGLSGDQLEAVFERFYRVDAARTRTAGGSGNGLAIVRALAEAMGGRAWAESPGLGRGATFLVELPAA